MHHSILPPFTPAMLGNVVEAAVFLFIGIAASWLCCNSGLPPFIRRGSGLLALLGFIGLALTIWGGK